MKILIILFASFFGFGLAIKETVRVESPAIESSKNVAALTATAEAPMLEVMLDTVEVSVSQPIAMEVQ